MITALNRRPTIRGFKHFVNMQVDDVNHSQTSDSINMINELLSSLNIRISTISSEFEKLIS